MLSHMFFYNGPFSQPHLIVMDAHASAQVFRVHHSIIVFYVVFFVNAIVPKLGCFRVKMGGIDVLKMIISMGTLLHNNFSS